PHVGAAWELETGWHDADDGYCTVIQSNGRSDYLRIPPERTFPQAITENRNRRSTACVVCLDERAPDCRTDAESREERSRHGHRREAFGFARRFPHNRPM